MRGLFDRGRSTSSAASLATSAGTAPAGTASAGTAALPLRPAATRRREDRPEALRLLIIGINFAPEMISTAVYTTGLTEAMAAAGHSVRVLSAHPYYPAWKRQPGWPRFAYRSERPAPGLAVTHCPLYVPARPSGLRRILHHLSFALTALPRALVAALRQRPDMVMVVAPSLISVLAGLPAARLCGARTWLHVQDYEVETAFATGLLQPGTRIGRLALRFERRVLQRFDRVSTISAPMLAKLPGKGVAAERIVELRNWADLARVRPLQQPSRLRETLGITTPHVALYAGSLGNKQGLELLPQVARRLAHRRDLTIVICGEGSYAATLAAGIERLDNIRLFPLQATEDLGELLGMATLHLLPQIADAADLVLPSKLSNMLASGRPVVATAAPGTALAREVEGRGLCTAPGDAEALAAAIETLLDDPALCRRLGESAHAHACARWDGTRILAGFEAELRALCRPAAPEPGLARLPLER